MKQRIWGGPNRVLVDAFLMASIRRALSPVWRPEPLMNGETLSKSSSNNQNRPSEASPLSSSLYKDQNFVSPQQTFDLSKLKGQIWRRSFLHFLMCFLVGNFLGFTPFPPVNIPSNIMPKHRDLDAGSGFYGSERRSVSAGDKIPSNEISTSEREDANLEHIGDLNSSSGQTSDKLLIIVTPMHADMLRAYYLSRLAHTLKLVPHPLLWIVVEMDMQSVEIAEFLRGTGVMYRHLICDIRNSSDGIALLRNVALSHIEKHHLDGIVYFADQDKLYSTEIFKEMRKISRFGTWSVAQLDARQGRIFLNGPVCNGSQVIGWHVGGGVAKRSRRFHAEMTGFAFNSTVIRGLKRWQQEGVGEGLQESWFIEKIVEGESQMDCFSAIMVWDAFNWFTGI